MSPLPRDDRVQPVERQRGAGWANPSKVEIPTFEGEGWISWVKKVERFFHVARIHPEDRVIVISDYLMGKAWDYYEWAMEEDPFMNWDELKFSMGQRFGSNEFKSP